jgi:hypothetical protein
MEAIDVTMEELSHPDDNLSVIPAKDSDIISVDKSQKVELKKRKGKVVQRNYDLNNVAALKKKMKAENK